MIVMGHWDRVISLTDKSPVQVDTYSPESSSTSPGISNPMFSSTSPGISNPMFSSTSPGRSSPVSSSTNPGRSNLVQCLHLLVHVDLVRCFMY